MTSSCIFFSLQLFSSPSFILILSVQPSPNTCIAAIVCVACQFRFVSSLSLAWLSPYVLMVLIVAALSPDFSHCGALKLKAHTHKQDTRRGIKRFRGLNKLNGDYFYCGPRRLAKRGIVLGKIVLEGTKKSFLRHLMTIREFLWWD